MRDNINLTKNLAILTDSYKVGMWKMYPPGTEYVYSYIESRGGPSDLLFFGLQIFKKTYLNRAVTMEDIDEAEEFWNAHFGRADVFNRANWEYIVKAHGGWLPIAIEAVAEGTVLPTKNVLVTVVNTDPKCYWLTTWMETLLLQNTWYACTVATNSWRCKQVIKKYLDMTCDAPEQELPFRMHDFGFRGVSSVESASIGGCAHLVNFMGTDTSVGAWIARKVYNEPMAGFSIPASEHSVISSWGRDNEAAAQKNMLDAFLTPGSIVASVSDTYDFYNTVENIWGVQLHDQIANSGARLVVRPDSGEPTIVPIDGIEILADKFGFTLNSKGYKEPPPCVASIQGDGITVDTLPAILEALTKRGFAANWLAYGQGGGLLQMVNRDDYKFAMKCSAIRVNGVWRDVYKDPATDPGKKSKKGQFALVCEDGKWETLPLFGHAYRNQMKIVYRNGEHSNDQTFADVRERAKK